MVSLCNIVAFGNFNFGGYVTVLDESDIGAPATRIGRPSVEHARSIADTIISCALEAFVRWGYGETSVEKIAAASGISKKTFYTRFSGKEDVFRAVVLRIVEANHMTPRDVAVEGVSLYEQLFNMAEQLLWWTLRPEIIAITRMSIAEASRFPELSRISAEYMVSSSVQVFSEIFAKASGGQLEGEALTFIANQFIHSVATEPFYRAVHGLEQPELDEGKRERLAKAIHLFLRGFPH